MDPVALLKALLINAAYQGASAVCMPIQADGGKPLPIDPLAAFLIRGRAGPVLE